MKITPEMQKSKEGITKGLRFFADETLIHYRVMYQVGWDVWMCRDKKNTHSRRFSGAYIAGCRKVK